MSMDIFSLPREVWDLELLLDISSFLSSFFFFDQAIKKAKTQVAQAQSKRRLSGKKESKERNKENEERILRGDIK